MDDTQRMSKLEVQCLNTVYIIGGAAAPVAGTHEAPHTCAGVQNMSDVLLRTVCKTAHKVRQGGGGQHRGAMLGSGSSALAAEAASAYLAADTAQKDSLDQKAQSCCTNGKVYEGTCESATCRTGM